MITMCLSKYFQFEKQTKHPWFLLWRSHATYVYQLVVMQSKLTKVALSNSIFAAFNTLYIFYCLAVVWERFLWMEIAMKNKTRIIFATNNIY